MAVGRANRISPGSDRMIVLGVLSFAVVILTIPIGRARIWEPNNARWLVGARDVVVIGGSLGGDGRSTSQR